MTFGAGDIYCVSCVFIVGIMPVDVGGSLGGVWVYCLRYLFLVLGFVLTIWVTERSRLTVKRCGMIGLGHFIVRCHILHAVRSVH